MTYWRAVEALTNIVFSFPVEDDLMSQAAQWGFVDPQLIERVFQQQCSAILPITCCWLQLVGTVKNLFTRVTFICSGLESVMYFSWGYTLRHSRNGREWGHLLIKDGRIFYSRKFKKKKICPKTNVCFSAYTECLHFSQMHSWPTVGTVKKHWEGRTKGKNCYYFPEWIYSGNDK